MKIGLTGLQRFICTSYRTSARRKEKFLGQTKMGGQSEEEKKGIVIGVSKKGAQNGSSKVWKFYR